MIALIQRVLNARVVIEGEAVGSIDHGLLALIGVAPGDNQSHADRCLHKLLNLRIFNDSQGKMNLSCQDIEAGLLLVPQFTLLADTSSGHRPSFTPAAKPEHSEHLFSYLLERARASYCHVQAGRFGADMQVHLVNDGPVTLSIEV